jgi:hypothetical protein
MRKCASAIIFAYGSMVLSFFCRLFFAPTGRKITYKGKAILCKVVGAETEKLQQ